MRSFLENLNYKLRLFMQGRYGFDELSKALTVISIVFFILYSLFSFPLFYIIAAAFIIWAYIRCFSKNFNARNKELSVYYRHKNKFTKAVSVRKRMWTDRKTHRYFKCKNCGAFLKVPKGKGKIEITCNVCKNKMIRKS